MKDSLPDIHCKKDFLYSINRIAIGRGSDEILFQMFNGRYSTSMHLLVLYSIAVGLNAKKIIEIGFGRSTLALLLAADRMRSDFYSCDRYDYSGYLKDINAGNLSFFNCSSDKFIKSINYSVDMAFLDYFSSVKVSKDKCISDIYAIIKKMKTNGIIAIHDSIEHKYNVKDAIKKIKKDSKLEVFNFPYNYGLCVIRNLYDYGNGKIKDIWQKKEDI